MATNKGYFIIANISGYTETLTRSESDCANKPPGTQTCAPSMQADYKNGKFSTP